MKLYGYWRSNATFRVRIALNLKGIEVDNVYLDLEAGDQFTEGYDAVNPQHVVPTLDDGGDPLFQSLAIVEYLDETHPEPPLLPDDPRGRARVRGLALIPSADAHPLVVPRIRGYLTNTLGVGDDQRSAWIRHWMGEGLRALEARLGSNDATGRFCHGDRVTLADVCLVPQVSASRLFDLPLEAYPTCVRIYETCMEMDAFHKAHPMNQPDYPGR